MALATALAKPLTALLCPLEDVNTGCGYGWHILATWRMDGHAPFRSDHRHDTAGGYVGQ